MSEFKIGDEVVCVDVFGVEYGLTLGKSYIVTASFKMFGEYMINTLCDEGDTASFYSNRFKLASEIEESAAPTEPLVEIAQSEYDELHDRIELLESLLVDANKRVEDLEDRVQVFNKPIEEYTTYDWRIAMNEGAEFQTANGDILRILGVRPKLEYPIETSLGWYALCGWLYDDNVAPQHNIIRRIK